MPRGIPRNRSEAVVAPDNPPVPASAASPRVTEVRRERRRRDAGDLDYTARLKLVVPQDIQEQLKREGKTWRWVRDDPGRMQQLQAEDWDKVPNVKSVAASRTDEGQLVLMAKYGDWYDADRAHLTDRNRENEKLAISETPGDASVSGEGFYTPRHATNRISRGA